jgi:hypothetical protein
MEIPIGARLPVVPFSLHWTWPYALQEKRYFTSQRISFISSETGHAPSLPTVVNVW